MIIIKKAIFFHNFGGEICEHIRAYLLVIQGKEILSLLENPLKGLCHKFRLTLNLKEYCSNGLGMDIWCLTLNFLNFLKLTLICNGPVKILCLCSKIIQKIIILILNVLRAALSIF